MTNLLSSLTHKLTHQRTPVGRRVAQGVVAGAVGGFIASWAMNHVHGLGQKFSDLSSGGPDGRGDSSHASSAEEHEQEEHEADPATSQVATAISRNVLQTELTEKQKNAADSMVHYGYGTLMGAIYGGLCEVVPIVGIGLGVPFGAALWLFGDELAVPLLGLGSSPIKAPVTTHVDAVAAHAVYGLTADGIRRNLRAGMRARCER